MKVAARLLAYAVLWACTFGSFLILALTPKLIHDSGSLWALLTHPVPRRWLFNVFAMIFTGRHLALCVLFGLVFGVLHLLICAGLGEWEAFKLPVRWRGLIAGVMLGMPLGGLYLLVRSVPVPDYWGGLLIVLVFMICGVFLDLWGGDTPRLRRRTDTL